MPIVLSRKGIDSSSGKMYSPMDGKTGEYAFIPHPEKENTVDEQYQGVAYKDLPTDFMDFNNLEEILIVKGKQQKYGAHLDPDLTKVLPIKNWHPSFGQRKAAQGYLRNRGVGRKSKGTLFLFFSRFKPWKKEKNSLKEGYYIYGWLEVDHTIIPKKNSGLLAYHPHSQKKYLEMTNNMIYVASDSISGTNLPGAGMVRKLYNDLRLSYYDEGDLLIFKFPKIACEMFSRLKNYKIVNEDHCLAKWPQSFGQSTVCPKRDLKKNFKK
ncbi:MAG: hypothetical protein GF308_16850 [Candidatus Heimdallarchaeota archaeon]|nr:hypothetical protein [Candidatus Heimdallarchaeota archaeon]